jgi:hypothetical protein
MLSNITPELADILVKCAILLLCISVFALLILFAKSGIISEAVMVGRRASQDIILDTLKNGNKFLDYDKINVMLKKKGISYYYKWVTPLNYVVIKVIAAFVGFAVGMSISWVAALALIFAGWYAFDVISGLSNQSDNNNLVDDIVNMYDTLNMESKANVNIQQSLGDCYQVVRNRRLKHALIDLQSDIKSKRNVTLAIDNFCSKFDHPYIESFGIVVKQGAESGQTAKILDDIGSQLKDLRHARNEREKRAVSRNVLICQLMIFVTIVVVTVMSLIGSFQGVF